MAIRKDMTMQGSAKRHLEVLIGRALLAAAAVVAATSAGAVEVYYQPIASVTVENDSNIDLDQGVRQQVQGYIADLATIVGIDTPDSTTVIRPRLVYRDYPKDTADDRLEAYLDFNSNFKTQRSNATLQGSAQHLDEFNAQFTSAVFNDIVPNQQNPDTGRVTNGSTQDVFLLAPKYVYSFTPTVGGGVSGSYQDVRYSPNGDTSHLDFDYYQGRAFLNWSYDQRSTLSFGGFASKFETKSVDSEATGSGALVNLNTNWTPLFSTTGELTYQHTSIDTQIPQPMTGVVNRIGGSIEASYKTEIDRFRLIARRSIAPSGGGAVYNTDRLQFQYDRSVTARLSMTGALVVVRTIGLEADQSGNDRHYGQALYEVHYALTQRFFLQGGYQYAYQKYQDNTDSASNNRVYIQFGYMGLGQQR